MREKIEQGEKDTKDHINNILSFFSLLGGKKGRGGDSKRMSEEENKTEKIYTERDQNMVLNLLRYHHRDK